MVSKVNEQINDPNNQSLLHREQHLEAIINIAEVIFRIMPVAQILKLPLNTIRI